MAKLGSLTGRGATRVMLSVFEGMGRSVRVAGQARLPEGKGEAGRSHDHVSHAGSLSAGGSRRPDRRKNQL